MRLTGADNGTRTRGLNLGKVALYQLSYVRMRSHRGEQRVSNIPELQRGRKLRRVAVLRGLSLRCLIRNVPI